MVLLWSMLVEQYIQGGFSVCHKICKSGENVLWFKKFLKANSNEYDFWRGGVCVFFHIDTFVLFKLNYNISITGKWLFVEIPIDLKIHIMVYVLAQT